MTAVPETRSVTAAPIEIARSFGELVEDWGDPHGTAQTAAGLLHQELGRLHVSIFALDVASGDLLLVGSAPGGGNRSPKGSRTKSDRGVIEAVSRELTVQRSLNYYVEPDFVLSLPGETRSDMGVPILAGDRLLGVIRLEYAAPQGPTQRDEEAAELIAARLAAAWAGRPGASAVSANDPSVSRKLHERSALAAISGALAQADDVADVFSRVASAAHELVRCRGAMLLMRHPSRQMLNIVASAGFPDLPVETLVPIEGSRVGQALRSGRALEIPTLSAEGEPVLTAGLLDTAPRNGLIVPVTSGGKPSGVLLVIDSTDADGFDPDDVQLLQALADQAGAAEALRTIPSLRQRISDASMIAEVGRAMTGTLGLDEVLALIVRAAEMLVGGRCASVALLSEDGADLLLAATSGSLQGKEGTRLPTRETVVGWVASTGESLISEALGTDPRGWPLGEEFGPAALVPLESHGEIRGVLLVGRKVGAPQPSDGDLDALRKLGAYASIALDNARLYRQQTELTRTLTAQAQELEKAYAELGASQERLLVSEKMAALGRITAGIAHEINSPLGSILNCLQLATSYTEEYRESAVDPEITADDHVGIATDILEALSLAEEATRRVGQFVRTIKAQTRMDEESVFPFDPAAEVNNTMLLLQHELDHGKLSLETDLEPGLQVHGDPSKFAVVVQNLVSNAADAYEGSTGVVRIRLRNGQNAVVLEIADEGCGIPEEIRPRIFDYLFTTKDVGHGTGLGLSLVHSIVTSHFQGAIDFRTEAGAGTTFAVTFPTRPEELTHGP
ncbi:MAG: GAF domain-containing protein [Gemmatimonadota bacterium]